MVPESMIRELLDHVALHLHGSHDEVAASLRGRFPAIHVTVCSDDDMPSRVRSSRKTRIAVFITLLPVSIV